MIFRFRPRQFNGELYQAQQAAVKTKRTIYDETKHCNEVDVSNQIRSYPMSVSISPERQVKDPSTIQISSTLIGKRVLLSTDIHNRRIFLFFSVSSPKQFVDLTKSASMEAINSAKQRLAQKQITPNKSQSLIIADATSPSSKRSHLDADDNSSSSSKRLKVSNNNQNIESVDHKRFADVMNMKSSYADLYSQMTLDEIFERL